MTGAVAPPAGHQSPRRREERGGEAGFTLIELAVATVVLLLAVLLACDLLAESGRVLHHSVRRARDPWPLLTAELLRNDLRGTAPPLVQDPPQSPPIVPPVGDWQSEAMILHTAEGPVVWQWMPDGRLLRRVDGGGVRAYLQDVRDFRWRRMGGYAIEVWVRHHTSSPYLRQLAGSLPRTDPGEDHDLHLLVVGRGYGAAQQW